MNAFPNDQPILKERYKLLHLIGQGQFSRVFEAMDFERHERVALKLLNLEDGIAQLMFRKEVDALSALNHENIVGILDHFEEPHERRVGIVLELVRGGKTLKDLLDEVQVARRPPPSPAWRLRQLLGILSALEHAHKRNIIHRDLKPTNLLYDGENDRLKLVDFGVARVLSHYATGKHQMTLRQFHTPPYSAPEQLMGRDCTFQTDLYAFGVVMAELLSMRPVPRTFDRSALQVQLEPLGREFASHPQSYQELYNLLNSLLDTTTANRPRLPEVERVLGCILDRYAERPRVFVRLTRAAEKRLQDIDPRFANPQLALEDLNAGLRAKYSEEVVDEKRQIKIHLFGESLHVVAKCDENDYERLVAVDVKRPFPGSLQAQRSKALAIPFSLQWGDGNAADFLNDLFERHHVTETAKNERENRRRQFDLASSLLEVRRKRTLRVYLFTERVQPSEEDQAAWRSKDEFAFFRVYSAALSDDPDDGAVDPELELSLLSSLGEHTTFEVEGKRVGQFHSLHLASRTLVVKMERPIKEKPEIVLVAVDQASETSLARQQMALATFFQDRAVNPRLGELLSHPERNRVGKYLPVQLIQQLDPELEMAELVGRILAAEDIFLVQGPPGTGKTTLIAELMAQILERNPNARILLTSQANEAVNNALDRLIRLRTELGKNWRILRDMSAYQRRKGHDLSFEAEFKAWIKETRERATKNFMEYRRSVAAEIGNKVAEVVGDWVTNLDRIGDVAEDYAEAVHVYGATCLRVPTLSNLLRENAFDWVIVDEAAKATSPELLVSLVSGKRFVLVGDHKQLPPFLSTEEEEELRANGFGPEEARISLFEELFKRINPSNRYVLRRQYRMHSSIARLVSSLAYSEEGGLETAVPDSKREIDLEFYNRPDRVFWLDIWNGIEKPYAHSFGNEAEVAAIVRELNQMEEELRAKNVQYRVGVIAPYARQVQLLRDEIKPSAKVWNYLQIDVDTVDAFQGKEKDILIYSMTRTNRGPRRFVSDLQRLNVAFSRAMRLLIIVGHRESATHDERLRAIVESVTDENVFRREV